MQTSPSEAPLSIRMANESDKRFVHSATFMTIAKSTNSMNMKREDFATFADRHIDSLIARSKVYIVYTPDVPDEVWSFAILEGQTLHMVYTKPPYRGLKIASGLVKDRATWYSHWCARAGDRFAQKLGISYNPFMLYKE